MNERFELLREAKVQEYNSVVKLYRHKKTGARVMSVINDDENKVFGITFRTPPNDSTGVPHIMEHSVLCGSKKYPLKEPFIELVKGSLNTFLNAMTYPDKTTYPVASQNEQDLYNLADVYMDAVLNPLIPPETLQQEGWHYELEDEKEPLSIKGVVYNEMKGVYSDPDSLLYRNMQQSVFTETTYGVDSGGDPAAIPELTYEQFKQFHETYYHPSNAWIYFYGDGDPERRLEFLDGYLSDFDAKDVNSGINLQPQRSEPARHRYFFDAEEEGDDIPKTRLMMSWLLPQPTPELDMALSVLSYMLVSTPASPLRKALIDSGLGEELTGGGLSDHLRQMTFSVGLKGIKAADAENVQALIKETLQSIADNGFTPELVEATINTLEFNLRENNTGSFPRGLDMMLDALRFWLHDGDPITAISFEKPLEYVKDNIAKDSQWLSGLIRDHLLNNPHLVVATLEPKVGLRQSQEEAEFQRLQDLKAKLDENEKQKIVEQTHALKEIQETPDDPEVLASLPTLTLDDIEKEGKELPIDVSDHEGTSILYHDLFTNGIVYLDVGFNVQTLPQEWIPYMPLFGHALIEIGTHTENDVEIAQRIRRRTGGIWTSMLNSARHDDPQGVTNMIIRGKATVEQAPEMLNILHDLLNTVNFDNPEKFKQMALRAKANRESGLLPGGHGIVNTRLRSHFSVTSWIGEQMGGLEQLFFLRRLIKQIDEDWPSVYAQLEEIRKGLLNRNHMFCNVTVDQKGWSTFAPELKGWLNSLPGGEAERQTWSVGPLPEHEGLALSAQVNYVGKAANIYESGYKYNGSVAVISKYIRTTWLWEKVRMQGGAYGGMCGFSRLSGVFGFLSYRDPNLLNTLKAYDATGDFLRQLSVSQEELSRSIIGTIGDIDTYRLPDAKGYTSMVRHLLDEGPERRQRVREEILGTTLQHFKDFADAVDSVRDNGHVVVMGPASNLEEANATLSPKLSITDVQPKTQG
ncbi:MAG: peptidase M16 [Deltaproteobacteria bacterium]|nr:MAG: peptidase M16 [Deltaproteobacteria bacterium]